jgi:NitT/TauT family transport system substrate-binding protein
MVISWRGDDEKHRETTPMKTPVTIRLLAAGALAIALAGPTGAAAQALHPWKHGIIAPKADAGFLLMAAKRGFAEQEGLKLELLEVKDDQIGLKALLAGELDSYEGGVQGAIAADVRGADVKIIGCHWVVIPHGIMVKSTIDKVADLKGKAIAVSAPGSFPDMLARVALMKYGLGAGDVRLAAVGGDRDRYTALTGGVVDAAVVSNEYLPLPSSKSLKMLVEGRDALPNFVRICMFSSGKKLAQRRDDAVRYLTAQSKALRFALGHRDETIKVATEATDAKADDPRPAFVYDDAVKVGAIAPDLPLPMDKLAWMQQQMVELGQIPKAGDLAKMVDPEIRAQALERAGK